MSLFRQRLGRAGEELAAKELQRKGYTICARNWRCRFGELDLIARKGTALAIVEVKTRSSNDFGSPAAAVTRRKQGQISRAAECWLQQNPVNAEELRFDVITILRRPGEAPIIEHLENAFDALRSSW